MQGTKDLEALKERIVNYQGPVLSAYLNVNPARSENQDKAYALRLKSALKDKELPQALVELVLEYVGRERLQTRMLVLFAASDGLFEVYRLHVELTEEVRWGEPCVVPLMMAIDDYRPSGVMLLDAQKFRFFVSYLGEIEEELDGVNLFSTVGWREITVAPSTALPRGGVAKDDFAHRLEVQTQRFYKESGDTLQQLVDRFGMERLILAGPEERAAAFLSSLPKQLQNLVVEIMHVPMEASAAEVMKRISGVEERIERAQEERILAEARERGVCRLQDTLEALKEGRVYHLLAPWPLDREVRWCDACVAAHVFGEDCPYCGRPTEIRTLPGVLLDLATHRGARIEFVRGENAESLREEFGGLAGLLRF